MATFNEWQTAQSVIRVQNPNYVGMAFDTFYKTWKSFNGGYKTSDPVLQLSVLDSRVRIPGKVQYTRAGSYQTRNIYASVASFMLNNANIDYMSRTNILDYVPRLYVKLTPYTEFLAKYVTGTYSQMWIPNYKPSLYNTTPGGRFFAPFDGHMFGETEFYVLETYTIYTNKTDGTQQNVVWSLTDYQSSGSPVDMYIPARWDNTSQTLSYIPYMSNIAPQILTSGGGQRGGTKIIGFSGGVGTVQNQVFTGINAIMATGDGDFVENPGTPDVPYSSGMAKQTQYPYFNYLIFCVATKKEWENVIAGAGMPWSEILDDVIKPDDSNLNKPTIPGQPNNPTGGGDGDGDNMSDDIPLPDVKFYPNSNAYNRYWITPAQLSDVQKWIFSETFFNDIRRLWNDPAEYLINLAFYPFDGNLHDVVHTQPNTPLSIGNLTSDIPCISIIDGYNAKFNGGSFVVNEYYGTYLDYAPYTTAEIYIPYIGYRNLNINDITGKTIQLLYVVDFDTNNITATILADDRPLTMYSGCFGVKLALSGTNANQLAETITQAALGTVTSIAGVVGGVVGNVATGNVPGAVTAGISGGVKTVENTVNSVMNTQVHPRYYGSPTPSTGLYNTQIPHIIFHRPISAEPKLYRDLCGYSAGYSGTVNEFSGFLKCLSVKIPANADVTQQEQDEITRLLLGGIFI